MKKDIKQVIDLWKETISDHIQEYEPYEVTHQLKQMAALFTPGLFYVYILNFQNIEMDYVDSGVKNVLGLNPEDVTPVVLMERFHPDEMKMMGKKEALVNDFLFRFLKAEEIPFYKIVYFMLLRDTKGKYHTILHQTTTLKVSDTGKVEHVLGVHTDVSHLNIIKNNMVSFISLNGGESYFNLDPEESIIFDPQNSNIETGQLQNTLTAREVEVVRLLAKGLNAERMAEELNLSVNTIRTHRRNILQKTGCNNTTEVVARCVMEGVI